MNALHNAKYLNRWVHESEFVALDTTPTHNKTDRIKNIIHLVQTSRGAFREDYLKWYKEQFEQKYGDNTAAILLNL